MPLLYGAWSIGSWSFYQGAFWIVMALILRCAAMTTGEMEQWIGDLYLKCMETCGITVKVAAAANNMDESTFRKCLRGESYRHITIMHAVRLGPVFMAHFSASLMWLTAKENSLAILETVNLRKGA